MPFRRGQSGNPHRRPLGASTAHAKIAFERLRIAAHRKAKIGEDGKPVLAPYTVGEEVDRLTVAADKLMELACEGNAWAIEHLANRLDGKVRESNAATSRSDTKVMSAPRCWRKASNVDIGCRCRPTCGSRRNRSGLRSYEEARAALLEEGIDVDRLPMLTDMRVPEGQDRS